MNHILEFQKQAEELNKLLENNDDKMKKIFDRYDKLEKDLDLKSVKHQNKWLLEQLIAGRKISAYEATQHGILRLAARMYDLRKKGHDIKSITARDGSKSWAVYYLQK